MEFQYKALPQHMPYTDTLVLDEESTLRGGRGQKQIKHY